MERPAEQTVRIGAAEHDLVRAFIVRADADAIIAYVVEIEEHIDPVVHDPRATEATNRFAIIPRRTELAVLSHAAEDGLSDAALVGGTLDGLRLFARALQARQQDRDEQGDNRNYDE